MNVGNIAVHTSCDRGAFAALEGGRYLVFRDAAGEVVGPAQLYPDGPTVPLNSIVLLGDEPERSQCWRAVEYALGERR